VIKNVIIGIIAIIVIAFILFPEFRKALYVLGSGFFSMFVQDIAKTPEGATAVYNEAIEEERVLYRKACNALSKVTGQLDHARTNLANLQNKLKEAESYCERLVAAGRESDAMIYAEKREEILADIEAAKAIIAEYEPMVAEAQTLVNQKERNLRKLKKDQKDKVNQMKLDMQTKQMHEDMDDLRNDRTTHKLLDAVDERAKDLRKEATGARMVHQSKTSTKIANIEKNMAQEKSSEYIASLKAKQNKK